MNVFNEMIRNVGDYYIQSDFKLDNSSSYKNIANTLLEKYKGLDKYVTRLCQLENSSPSGVKRLNKWVLI